jgi:glucose/arabinose dehydrogenase
MSVAGRCAPEVPRPVIELAARVSHRTTLLISLLLLFASGLDAATVPSGFTDTLVAGSLNAPTAFAFAPDGRIFIAEQAGRLRVVKDGVLLDAPFLTVTVNASGERGLLGVAFDPAFAVNHYVYVYYTATSPVVHNRISRFTASGDVAVAGSEVILFELDTLGATNHNGGAIHFGPDGKLYVAVGDNAYGANAQSMSTVFGKMLRLNADGTIPADNPFYGSTTGKYRSIWALGLRNPFTFEFDPGSAMIFINDVGQSTWEEIDDGVAGANYGWPETEGPTTDPRFRSPRYAYQHSSGDLQGCAITGGTFYSPAAPGFPSQYLGDYFFADYCAGWIAVLDPDAGNTVSVFATGADAPVDLHVSDDGGLFYLVRGDGSAGAGGLFRIDYGQQAPVISVPPSDATVAPGDPVSFSVQAGGSQPLSYQWQRNGANIAGATQATYTIASVATADNGARFRALVTNQFGSATSADAVLTVSGNSAPKPTILQPAAGTLYTAGTNVAISGDATDLEDGTLPAGAFTWRVDFHHDDHIHPFLQGSGAKTGIISIPNTGETSANVWYRINLDVTDSGGRTASTYRDLYPRKATITLATSPAGLQVTLDGQPQTTPLSVVSVVGMLRTLGAASPQTVAGITYDFVSWSDGGAQTHSIATPSTDTTYTATFRARTSCAVPGSPTSLTAQVSGRTITAQWKAPSSGGTPSTYLLEGGMAPGTTSGTVNVAAPQTSASMTAPPGTYFLRVRAQNSCGTSGPSNEVSVVVQ